MNVPEGLREVKMAFRVLLRVSGERRIQWSAALETLGWIVSWVYGNEREVDVGINRRQDSVGYYTRMDT